MSKGLAVILSVIAIFAVIVLVTIGSLIGFNNTAVKMENGIKAQYQQNQNNYDNYFKQLKEAAQVPEIYVDDMRKVWKEVMTARYGTDGSRAMFNWIKEHNPAVEAKLYLKLQIIITAGRNRFEADQKILIDKKREYENLLGTFPNSFFAGFLNFPKINLADYGIVTSDETQRAFDSKKSEPFKIKDSK